MLCNKFKPATCSSSSSSSLFYSTPTSPFHYEALMMALMTEGE